MNYFFDGIQRKCKIPGRNSLKKQVLSTGQIQNFDVRYFVKTSERSKVVPEEQSEEMKQSHYSQAAKLEKTILFLF